MGPFAVSGIELKGYRLTKKQLKAWAESSTPHLVLLYTMGGVFTSNGDGTYESHERKFDSMESFWLFARDFRQGAVMTET